MSKNKKYFIFFLIPLLLYNSCSAKINFKSNSSSLTVKTGSQLILNTPMTGINGIVTLPDNIAATVSATSTSNLLTFSNGTLFTGIVSLLLTGTFDPASTDTISLYNGDSMDVKSGTILQAISVAASSTATILGQPSFSSAISLSAASSVIQLGITTPLNQAVSGSGTLKLVGNLSVMKNVSLPSLVNINGYRLSLFGGTYSSAVTFSGGGIIETTGNITLSSTWTIGSGAEVYTLNCCGNVLDLGSAGIITFNGTELLITNTVIKNLSGSQINGTGEIKLSNVTLHLDAAYTRADGKFTVLGSNCKIITNGYAFTMSGSGNNLTINGVYLLYEQLNGTTNHPFSFTSSATLSKLTAGDTMQVTNVAGTGGGGGSYTPTAGLGGIPFSFDTTPTTLDKNYTLTSSGACTFTNSTPATPKPFSLNGAGHYFDFPFASGSFFNLEGNVQLSITNTVFKNFYPAGISLASLSTITYGDGVRIELGPDITMASGDVAWTFNGNAEIDGNGATLTLNKSQGITITNAKTLTLKNMRIVTSTVDAFKCLSSTAKIKLQNVELILTANFTYSQGSLDFTDFVKILGDTGTGTTARNFEFSSSGAMTITNASELFVGSGINFKYNADPTGAANFAATKRKFSMAQQGCKWTLQDCSIETTNTGLALDLGTMQIIDTVTFLTTANSYAQFEIGAALNINIASGALFKINGLALYNE